MAHGMWVGAGGVWKKFTANTSVGVSSVHKKWMNAYVGAGGVWKQCFSSLSVTANSVTRQTSGVPFCGAYLSTGGPNTTVTGGSGSYTYSWSRIGACHASGCLVISSAGAQNPTWSGSACDGDTPDFETWQVIVTDTVFGTTAATSISVIRRHLSIS